MNRVDLGGIVSRLFLGVGGHCGGSICGFLLWMSERRVRALPLVMACLRSKKFEGRCQICVSSVETGLFACLMWF